MLGDAAADETDQPCEAQLLHPRSDHALLASGAHAGRAVGLRCRAAAPIAFCAEGIRACAGEDGTRVTTVPQAVLGAGRGGTTLAYAAVKLHQPRRFTAALCYASPCCPSSNATVHGAGHASLVL